MLKDKEVVKFIEETPEIKTTDGFWKVLIADDSSSVHLVTEMVLKDFIFENKTLKILKAYTAEEAINILEKNPDIAVIFLDVVMETLNAGLDAVPIIRGQLNNHTVRIIVRTGQSGSVATYDAIEKYDINDYRNKAFLDHDTLINAITFALRDYRDIINCDRG